MEAIEGVKVVLDVDQEEILARRRIEREKLLENFKKSSDIAKDALERLKKTGIKMEWNER